MYDKLKIMPFFVAFFFIATTTNAQCAMCKAVVENGDVGMAEGINSGITYLMVFPYILVAILFYFIYRYRRRLKN